ncbi:hypothetical protein F4815DRAFT_441426 [Daldinia loculata]|nr:hypothetical protein F4815DRAFT_441426 [Daldinia loculata]
MDPLMDLPPDGRWQKVCPHGMPANSVSVVRTGSDRASCCDECRLDLSKISQSGSEVSHCMTRFAQEYLNDRPQFQQEVLRVASEVGEMAYTAESSREQLDREEYKVKTRMAAARHRLLLVSPGTTYPQPGSSSTLNNAGPYGTDTVISSGVRLPSIIPTDFRCPRSASLEYRPGTPTRRLLASTPMLDIQILASPISRGLPTTLLFPHNPAEPQAEPQGAKPREPDESVQSETPPSTPAKEDSRNGWGNGDFRGFGNGNGQGHEGITYYRNGDVLPTQPPQQQQQYQQQQQPPQPQPEPEPEPEPQHRPQYRSWRSTWEN